MGQRQFTRVGFKIVAAVTCDDTTIQGEVDNISLHGIFIKDVSIPKGKSAEITMHLSTLQPEIMIKIDAASVRTTDEGTAFEFTRVDVDSFIHLRKVVSYASCDGDTVMGEFANYVDHKIHEHEDSKHKS